MGAIRMIELGRKIKGLASSNVCTERRYPQPTCYKNAQMKGRCLFFFSPNVVVH